MKIGIVGATGKAGSLILDEAKDRGHEVTAIVRNANKLNNKDVKVIEKEVQELVKEDFNGLDVVVNAFGAQLGEKDSHIDTGSSVISSLSRTELLQMLFGVLV